MRKYCRLTLREIKVVISSANVDEPQLDVIPSWMKQRPPHRNVNYKKLERRRSTRREKRQAKRSAASMRSSSASNHENSFHFDYEEGERDEAAVGASATAVDLSKVVDLESRPTVSISELLEQDTIACKFLELDPVNWSPTISDWKFGVVQSVNNESQTLRLKMITTSKKNNTVNKNGDWDAAEEQDALNQLDDVARARYEYMASLNQLNPSSSDSSVLDLNFGEIYEAKLIARTNAT